MSDSETSERLRVDLIDAASRESEAIVEAAATDIRRAIARARQELEVVNGQLRATLHPPDSEDPLRPQRLAPGLLAACDELEALISEVAAPAPPRSALEIWRSVGVERRSRPRARRLSRGFLILLSIFQIAAIVTTAMWVSGSSSTALAPPRAVPPVGGPVSAVPPASISEPKPAVRALAATPTPTAPTRGENDVGGAAARWLDGYFSGDAAKLATAAAAAASVSDERGDHDRPPPSLQSVQRTVTRPNVRVYNDAAVVTASVTERAPTGVEWVSYVSQLWTRRAGAWHLDEARIVSASALTRALRQ